MDLDEKIDTLETIKGHIEPADLAGRSDQEIVEGWQEVQGIKSDGVIGNVTARAANAPRTCGVLDRLFIGGEPIFRRDNTKWNGSGYIDGDDTPCRATYFVNGYSTALGKQKTEEAIAEAAAAYPEACNVEMIQVTSREAADLVIDFGPIDERGGTLAWCQIPEGPNRQQKMLVDNSEQWVISANPTGGYTDIVRTVRHELGHFWGMLHIAIGNLMQAMYSDSIRGLQAGDIKGLIERYGPKRQSDNPPPSPGAKCIAEIRFDGRHFYGELESTTT